MKYITIILMILALMLFPFVSGTVTHVINAPADLFQSDSSSVVFNWTANSTANATLTSHLWLSPNGNTSFINSSVFNVSASCTNNTACNVTVSGLSVGYYNWTLQTEDADGNSSFIDSRLIWVRSTVDDTFTKWMNILSFEAMKLNMDTGDLHIAGDLILGNSSNTLLFKEESNGTHILLQSYVNLSIHLLTYTPNGTAAECSVNDTFAWNCVAR